MAKDRRPWNKPTSLAQRVGWFIKRPATNLDWIILIVAIVIAQIWFRS